MRVGGGVGGMGTRMEFTAAVHVCAYSTSPYIDTVPMTK